MSEKQSQLHELLAAEPDLRGQANKILLETQQNFGKAELFRGSSREFVPFSDADALLKEESYEELPTTVEARIGYTFDKLAPYWDAVFQKESTNQQARADIVVNGVSLAKDVPATVLLGLETRLTELRNVLASMPTLDVKTAWVAKPGGKPGEWQSQHPTVTFRTKKVTKPLVLSPATQHQQAIVKRFDLDIEY